MGGHPLPHPPVPFQIMSKGRTTRLFCKSATEVNGWQQAMAEAVAACEVEGRVPSSLEQTKITNDFNVLKTGDASLTTSGGGGGGGESKAGDDDAGLADVLDDIEGSVGGGDTRGSITLPDEAESPHLARIRKANEELKLLFSVMGFNTEQLQSEVGRVGTTEGNTMTSVAVALSRKLAKATQLQNKLVEEVRAHEAFMAKARADAIKVT